LRKTFNWSFCDKLTVRNIVDSTHKINLIIDYDADGLTSGVILSLYLDRIVKPYNVRLFNRSDGFVIREDYLDRDSLNIILDRGSPEYSSGLYDNYNVLIIDHHQSDEYKPRGKAIIVNPHCVENEIAPCTSLIVQRLFGNCYTTPLALVGTLGDYCSIDYDTTTTFLDNWSDDTPWGRLYSPSYIRYHVVPRINSCARIGKVEYAWDFLRHPSPQTLRLLKKANEERKSQSRSAQPLQVLESDRVSVAIYPRELQGHISYLAAREAKRKPVGIACFEDGEVYRVSIRSQSCNLQPIFLTNLAKLGGHKYAGGGYIPRDNLEDFLREIESRIEESKPEDLPILQPEHTEDTRVIESLEIACLNPPTKFIGGMGWESVGKDFSQTVEAKIKPKYLGNVLHWGRPQSGKRCSIESWRGKLSMEWSE
jgi:single-stranded DNA-specific DHH superfamily exonuclease